MSDRNSQQTWLARILKGDTREALFWVAVWLTCLVVVVRL